MGKHLVSHKKKKKKPAKKRVPHSPAHNTKWFESLQAAPRHFQLGNKYGVLGAKRRIYKEKYMVALGVEKEVWKQFIDIFPGKATAIINAFLAEAIRKRPLMIFKLEYPEKKYPLRNMKSQYVKKTKPEENGEPGQEET